MAIFATDSAKERELIPEGNYVARCFRMLEIGTVTENIQGTDKTMHKVRLEWELPTELRTYGDQGEFPCTIGQDYTLSMNEKSNLRKMLQSWRGKAFTPDEAKKFDITCLIGLPCMINIIHKPSAKDPSKVYENIASIAAMPKGMPAPAQVNPSRIFSFDSPDLEYLETLPDFIKDKVKSSVEYKALTAPKESEPVDVFDYKKQPEPIAQPVTDDLPF